MLNVIEAIEKQLQAQKDDIFFKDLQIKELKGTIARLKEELNGSERGGISGI